MRTAGWAGAAKELEADCAPGVDFVVVGGGGGSSAFAGLVGVGVDV